MKLDLLINVKFLSEFNQDSVDSIEVVAVVATSGSKV